MIVLVATVACKKNKGPADGDTAKPDTSLLSQLKMTAKINNVEWQTDSAYSYRVKNSGADTSQYNLMLVGTKTSSSDYSTININITDYKGKGVYKIEPPINTITYYNNNIRHYASSGTFTVASVTDNLLSGTFSFVADTVTVKEGEFTVAKP